VLVTTALSFDSFNSVHTNKHTLVTKFILINAIHAVKFSQMVSHTKTVSETVPAPSSVSDVMSEVIASLTLCSRATTKVVFSVTRFDPRSQLSSFSHAPFCECVCRQV
jgi:hypothetical protein